MSQEQHTPQFKAKLVLKVIQGKKDLDAIALENDVDPDMLRDWMRVFQENASNVFAEEQPKKAKKKAKREEEARKKEKSQLEKTIGQLTLERDFLKDCFRQVGLPIPELVRTSTEHLSVRRQY